LMCLDTAATSPLTRVGGNAGLEVEGGPAPQPQRDALEQVRPSGILLNSRISKAADLTMLQFTL
jgi:hypothetical protein